MSPRPLLPALLVLCVGFAAALATEEKRPATIVRNPAPVAPAETDLTTYYFGLLTKGSRFSTYDQDERAQIQAAHLANINRLAREGKLLVAGPFDDDGDWRGLFIYKCASLAEARALAQSDPAVQAGRLQIEIHPWLTQKGAIRDPEFPPAR